MLQGHLQPGVRVHPHLWPCSPTGRFEKVLALQDMQIGAAIGTQLAYMFSLSVSVHLFASVRESTQHHIYNV